MKTKNLMLALLLTAGTTTLFAQQKTEKFKVYGNCGSCEKRIETAAKSVDGVSLASWSQDTKMIEVTFDTTKTNLDAIEQAIAKVGHDTQIYRANDEVYAKLPGCCQYDRADATENPKPDKKVR
jgi:mercuric ion binding protein